MRQITLPRFPQPAWRWQWARYSDYWPSLAPPVTVSWCSQF